MKIPIFLIEQLIAYLDTHANSSAQHLRERLQERLENHSQKFVPLDNLEVHL